MKLTWPEYRDTWLYADDEAGLRAAQADLGVPVTGVWDATTERTAVRTPRCGCLDAQNLGESKWGVPEVTWFPQSYPGGGITNDRADAIFAMSFLAISRKCGLKFRRVNSADQANILIQSGRGSRMQLDGRGGTLAYAYLPPGSRFSGQVRVVFDLDEFWTEDARANGTLLLNVATHEFLHNCGLSHNNVANQLMNPIYKPSIATPQHEDIRQIVSLYGQPAAQPSPTPNDPTTPTTPSGLYIVATKHLRSDDMVEYTERGLGTPKIMPRTALVNDPSMKVF